MALFTSHRLLSDPSRGLVVPLSADRNTDLLLFRAHFIKALTCLQANFVPTLIHILDIRVLYNTTVLYTGVLQNFQRLVSTRQAKPIEALVAARLTRLLTHPIL